MDEPSVFTQIIRGEIPCHKIFEDDKTFAFLDIYPSTQGHTLVITKKQVEFIWDLEDEDYAALMNTVQKVGRHLKKQLGVPYVGIKVIGTDVPHVHVHLVPFSSSSEYSRGNVSDEPDHNTLKALAEKLAF